MPPTSSHTAPSRPRVRKNLWSECQESHETSDYSYCSSSSRQCRSSRHWKKRLDQTLETEALESIHFTLLHKEQERIEKHRRGNSIFEERNIQRKGKRNQNRERERERKLRESCTFLEAESGEKHLLDILRRRRVFR